MEITKKTGYQWSLEANIRLINLSDWEVGEDFTYSEESYYEERVDLFTFYERLKLCRIKPNSQPRKTELYLEYRMYGLVPYNMSPIQQGIQFGHAVVDYGQNVRGMGRLENIYNKWANKDKTFIILNGGTTNNNPDRLGTLNKHLLALQEANIMVQHFCEPDLGDQLTAIVFLIDERVFNKALYPDFMPETLPLSHKKPSERQMSELETRNTKNYEYWVEKIGGEANAFLREYLKPLKLA